MLLMCKNKKVFNIETEEVYNAELLPGLMCKGKYGLTQQTFKSWMKLRHSSGSNTLARQLRAPLFGQGNRGKIDVITRSLSLSDCYWLKDEFEDIKFEGVSPYYTAFWRMGLKRLYKDEAIPTLYTGGYLPKEWKNKDILWKQKNEIEVLCSRLCEYCGVPIAEVSKAGGGGINVKNFTTPEIMLEQANMSGKFDEYFTEDDIVGEFGVRGVEMIIIDAIVGNGDRHDGNFGYIRSSDTGKYLGMAPLYDFDMALQGVSKTGDDLLVRAAIECINKTNIGRELVNTALEFLDKRRKVEYKVFKVRALKILAGVM